MDPIPLFYTLPHDVVGYIRKIDGSAYLEKGLLVIKKGEAIPLQTLGIFYCENKIHLAMPRRPSSGYCLLVADIGSWEVHCLHSKWVEAFDAGRNTSASKEMQLEAQFRATKLRSQIMVALRAASRAQLTVVRNPVPASTSTDLAVLGSP